MTDLTHAQATEVEKYVYNYAHDDPKKGRYGMGKRRLKHARSNVLYAWDNRVSAVPMYLDIGCGRGEMLSEAATTGFIVQGVEVVPDLCTSVDDPSRPFIMYAPAWDLPFGRKEFDLVTMFDVLEHLLPGDTGRSLREIKRVAAHHVFLTANNRPDVWNGFDMHVNRRPYAEWDQLIKDAFSGSVVTWLPREGNISETWRIDI